VDIVVQRRDGPRRLRDHDDDDDDDDMTDRRCLRQWNYDFHSCVADSGIMHVWFLIKAAVHRGFDQSNLKVSSHHRDTLKRNWRYRDQSV